MTSVLDIGGQAGDPEAVTSRLYIGPGRRATAMRNDVRERRTAKGLAQAELARELAVSRQTINSIETGRYTPSLPLAIAIARFFGSSVEEIFHADHD